MFWGRYKARVDSNRRLVIPKPFRDMCGDSVMVSMGLDGWGQADVLPPQGMGEIGKGTRIT